MLLLLLSISNLVVSLAIQGFGSKSGVITPAQAGMYYKQVDIQGSPYVDEVFKKGRTLINGNYTSDALMRYDAIEIKNENGVARTLLRRNNIVAIIDGKTYIVREYLELGENKMGYFNPITEGYARILKRPKKIFVQAQSPNHGYNSFTYAKYEDISTYYIQKGDESAIEIRLSKKRF
ncbi:hypothetical protein [Maribacter sp. ACAM166]|uniref:hypothetical protein n=1 Tax=Maribacter sp. ACAM166 TaxID=2508996 RepID=UPI0010FDF06A|nr:hypothetical protein [Maribacter sp. ACAM166]TLP82253.1 hypothetical protein ES765_02130 [Maribacter sp. ACAM166]